MKHSLLFLSLAILTGCTTAQEKIFEDDFCKTGPSIKIEHKSDVPLAADEGLVAGTFVTAAGLLGKNFYVQATPVDGKEGEIYRYCRASGFFVFKLKTGKYTISIARTDFEPTNTFEKAEFQIVAGQVLDLGTMFSTCEDWSTTENNRKRFIETWKIDGSKAYKKTNFSFKKSVKQQCLLIFANSAHTDEDFLEFQKKNSSLKWTQPPTSFYNPGFFKL